LDLPDEQFPLQIQQVTISDSCQKAVAVSLSLRRQTDGYLILHGRCGCLLSIRNKKTLIAVRIPHPASISRYRQALHNQGYSLFSFLIAFVHRVCWLASAIAAIRRMSHHNLGKHKMWPVATLDVCRGGCEGDPASSVVLHPFWL
jgi:hypothetical protein